MGHKHGRYEYEMTVCLGFFSLQKLGWTVKLTNQLIKPFLQLGQIEFKTILLKQLRVIFVSRARTATSLGSACKNRQI